MSHPGRKEFLDIGLSKNSEFRDHVKIKAKVLLKGKIPITPEAGLLGRCASLKDLIVTAVSLQPSSLQHLAPCKTWIDRL
jgi:hypothetical protein